jgi:hypothetical protein
VEVHNSGGAGEATFKWSRENGSLVFPIEATNGSVITLVHVGRDERLGLKVGDWVEAVDDDSARRGGNPGLLLQVIAIDRLDRKVTLEDSLLGSVGKDFNKHPLLRRWDHKWDSKRDAIEADPNRKRNGLPILEGIKDSDWITLEDGIQIRFQPSKGESNYYRTGDYWLIPARTTTGGIEWPGWDTKDPTSRPPRGVEHHYAPLAIILLKNRTIDKVECRLQIPRLAIPI